MMLRVAALLLLFPCGVSAQTRVDLRLALQPNTHVIAALNAGRVTISTWTHDSIAVTGVRHGSKVTLRATRDSVFVQQRDGEAELSIRIPQGTSLTVRAAIAGVTVNGILSYASLRTTSGQLVINGSIAELISHTITGQIQIKAATERVDASSFTGQLIYQPSAQTSHVTLRNHSGRIVITLSRQPQVNIDAGTVHGRVIDERRVIARSGAVVKARTFTGHIVIREEF